MRILVHLNYRPFLEWKSLYPTYFYLRNYLKQEFSDAEIFVFPEHPAVPGRILDEMPDFRNDLGFPDLREPFDIEKLSDSFTWAAAEDAYIDIIKYFDRVIFFSTPLDFPDFRRHGKPDVSALALNIGKHENHKYRTELLESIICGTLIARAAQRSHVPVQQYVYEPMESRIENLSPKALNPITRVYEYGVDDMIPTRALRKAFRAPDYFLNTLTSRENRFVFCGNLGLDRSVDSAHLVPTLEWLRENHVCHSNIFENNIGYQDYYQLLKTCVYGLIIPAFGGEHFSIQRFIEYIGHGVIPVVDQRCVSPFGHSMLLEAGLVCDLSPESLEKIRHTPLERQIILENLGKSMGVL